MKMDDLDPARAIIGWAIISFTTWLVLTVWAVS